MQILWKRLLADKPQPEVLLRHLRTALRRVNHKISRLPRHDQDQAHGEAIDRNGSQGKTRKHDLWSVPSNEVFEREDDVR